MNAVFTTFNLFAVEDESDTADESSTFVFVDDATYEFVGGGMAANGI